MSAADDEHDDSASTSGERLPLCSVLSTVVSHVMSPPSPLEPEEWKEQCDNNNNNNKQAISVPILRVFGPIVRGDAPSGQDPVQSACLYIHGAFPYLLARPVTAGPDGSLHHSSHLIDETPSSDQSLPSMTSSGHVDWDNAQAIERIASVIKGNLEAALQAALMNTGENSNNNSNNKDGGGGKGNSTPVALFIRSVTVVVGRGFYTYCPGPPAPFLRVEYYDPKMKWKVRLMLQRGLDLPHMYHPDPQQYDAVGLAPAVDSSQLGLESLAFHCYEAHIPYTMQFFKDWNLAGMSYIHLSDGKFRRQLPGGVVRRWESQRQFSGGEISQLAFLSSNTPAEHIWDSEQETNLSERQGTPMENVASGEGETGQSSQLGYGKRSSNHQSSVPPKTKSVPFWAKKETSCDVEIDVHVTDILNVKSIMKVLPKNEVESQNIHWRAVPSLREIWQEERRRMAKLLEPEDDFLSRQSASDIGETGDKGRNPPPFTLSVKKDASTPGAMLAAKGMKRLLNITDGLESDFVRASRQIVSRHSAAISKVDKMLLSSPAARGDVTSANSRASQLTPPVDDAINALGALASQFEDGSDEDSNELLSSSQILDTFSDTDNDHDRHPFTPSQTSPGLESASTKGGAHQSYGSSMKTDFNSYSQGSSTTFHELADKEYELSQRVDRGESIASGRFQKAEDFIDPETLAPYDSQEEDGDDESDDELDEEGMERVLTVLATQLDDSRDGNGMMGNNQMERHQNTDRRNPTVPAIPEDTADIEALSLGSSSVAGDENSSQSSDESTESPPPIQTVEQQAQEQSSLLQSQLNEQPPSRGSLAAPSSCLLPLSSKEVCAAPSWLGHAVKYQSFREKASIQSNWGPQTSSAKGHYVQPTQPPPRRDEVVFWCRREKKRSLSKERLPFGKKGKTAGFDSAKDTASAKLEVDTNTGKVVPSSKNSGNDVEEVQWEATQSQVLSLTQDRCQDFPQDAATPSLTAASRMDSQAFKKVGADLSSATQANVSVESEHHHVLQGMQNQGGRLVVEGGGQLKARTRPSQSCRDTTKQGRKDTTDAGRYLPLCLTLMSIEVHVQCRTGRAGVGNANIMAMTPDPDRDKIFAIAYVYGRDPGGGEALQILERGCLFVPLEHASSTDENRVDRVKASMPREILGVVSPLSIEKAKDEKQLLLRLASIVRIKDPDLLVSWDPQGAGLGYIVERGANLGKTGHHDSSENNSSGLSSKLDMCRLLGRNPQSSGNDTSRGGSADAFFGRENEATSGNQRESGKDGKQQNWAGSGMGGDWDDRVGAGSAAASIAGRLVFAGWKIIAEEVKHPNSSSLEAMISTVLSTRIPFHDELNLTNWYGCMNGRERWRVLHHRLAQSTATLLLFDALDIIGRAGEAARLSGCLLSQSFPGIRGSQYKVEGVLLRALQSLNSEERGSKRGQQKVKEEGASASLSAESKSQATSPWKTRRKAASPGMEESSPKSGYFFFSPGLQDTNKQEALEVQALTLEPQSGHHTDPVVVCDFTALYPSLMIAYNLCYSTCAGRLSYHTTRREMRREGRTTGKIGPFLYSENRTATVLKHHMKSCSGANQQEVDCISPKDRAYVAPTGTIFVSESVVRGVLPQVLDELLSTRAMLKKASKEYKKRVPDLAPSILRQLEARQLALKYVANVTYGYTSATFSGRCAMPLLADSIVECGRRTLTNAINLANSWGREEGGRWHGCEVLYGDTDSVFVKLPGRSVNEAFDFGEHFCRTVTSLNPPPVQLKLEKVYLGSILQTKKKYCGMKFESRDTKSPGFEAKGIETIRRDQCALTQKILKNSLVMLFRHGVQAVKEYLFRQWSLIISGQLPVSDFVITGRVRSKYRGVGPVQATLHRRLAEADPGRVMRHKERLSYVIVAVPGVTFRLRDCVLTPMELLAQWDSYTIFSTYYIEKHVNASLQRCFGLAPHFIDIKTWYAECPKPRRRIHFWPVTRTGGSSMISAYFGSDCCSLCGNKCLAQGRSRAVVCSKCKQDDVHIALVASRRLQKVQREALDASKTCSDCSLCYEDPSTFAPVMSPDDTDSTSKIAVHRSKGLGRQEIAMPIAACTSIDCPNTFKRHRLREETLEAEAICKALNVDF